MDIRHFTLAVTLAAAAGWFPAAGAVTVVKCVDADGEVSFRDSCPPEMTKQGEKKLRGTGRGAGAGDDRTDGEALNLLRGVAGRVTLYVVDDCEPCVLVREVLAGRNVPFTEVDVGTDPDVQEQLRQRSGALKVPTVAAGERIITGYSRDKLEAALDEMGFAAAAEP